MGGVHPWHPPSRIDNGFKSVRDLSMVSKLLAIIRNSTSKLTLYHHEMVIEEQLGVTLYIRHWYATLWVDNDGSRISQTGGGLSPTWVWSKYLLFGNIVVENCISLREIGLQGVRVSSALPWIHQLVKVRVRWCTKTYLACIIAQQQCIRLAQQTHFVQFSYYDARWNKAI